MKATAASPYGEIRHPKKRAFLAAIANTCNIVRAATIAKCDRDNHYHWLKKDPLYARLFEVAWGRGVDVLEAEAVRRAYEGTAKPIFHGGKRAMDVDLDEHGKVKLDKDGKPVEIPAVVREYDSTLLIFLLKGARPEKYRERFEHTGKDGEKLFSVEAVRAYMESEETTA